jgi:hypothetical protein
MDADGGSQLLSSKPFTAVEKLLNVLEQYKVAPATHSGNEESSLPFYNEFISVNKVQYIPYRLQ